MSPAALALVLVAACAHATWNLLAKGAEGGAVFVWLTTLVAVAAQSPLALGIAVAGHPRVARRGSRHGRQRRGAAGAGLISACPAAPP